jgi:hypothetical protein
MICYVEYVGLIALCAIADSYGHFEGDSSNEIKQSRGIANLLSLMMEITESTKTLLLPEK